MGWASNSRHTSLKSRDIRSALRQLPTALPTSATRLTPAFPICCCCITFVHRLMTKKQCTRCFGNWGVGKFRKKQTIKRADYVYIVRFEKRCVLMADWAEYLARPAADIVRIRRALGAAGG